MKTIEQFFKEIMENKELEASFLSAVKENKLEELLKENQVDGTGDDLSKLVTKAAQSCGALSDDELEAVSGGSLWDTIANTVKEKFPSVYRSIDEWWYQLKKKIEDEKWEREMEEWLRKQKSKN
ncbi:MAG: hypothetical protein ACI4J1_08985 [Ruminiclostridium sp.]